MIKRLKISDPPTAVAERGTVLGGEGCSVELACMVEGELITLDCVQVQQHKTKDIQDKNFRCQNKFHICYSNICDVKVNYNNVRVIRSHKVAMMI